VYSFSENFFDIKQFLLRLQQAEFKRLILFGAGGWGEALHDELIQRDISLPIYFADNDPSKQGLNLKDKPILCPQEIHHHNDIVVITTISAGDKVSNQLEGMGFARDVNYFEVMHSLNYQYPFNVMDFYNNFVEDFEGLDILHIGPGGQLGVELLLYLMGAKSVFAVEYHSFNLSFPEITRTKNYYDNLGEMAIDRDYGDIFEKGLIKREQERFFIDQTKIHLLYPCSVTALPFADRSFDLILHHAVFEHVMNPERGYGEIFRTLKPGGMTIGLVDPQDHRVFSTFKEYYPLKFLEYSREEWNEIAKNINYHNQITFPEHKEMILTHGFDIKQLDILMETDITDEMWQKFNPTFRRFDAKEIGVLRFAFLASRPNESLPLY